MRRAGGARGAGALERGRSRAAFPCGWRSRTLAPMLSVLAFLCHARLWLCVLFVTVEWFWRETSLVCRVYGQRRATLGFNARMSHL